MTIKEVKRDGIERKRAGYAADIVQEFIDSGFDAALVDLPEDKTVIQAYYAIQGRIKHAKLDNDICATRRGDKIYLLKK